MISRGCSCPGEHAGKALLYQKLRKVDLGVVITNLDGSQRQVVAQLETGPPSLRMAPGGLFQ